MNDAQVSRELRLGYLVPEFPGQTHGFFWRELRLPRQLDVSPDVVSTRSPGGRSAKQDWAATAQEFTTYLAPMSIPAVARTLGQLLRVSPRAAAELLRVVGAATGGITELVEDKLSALLVAPGKQGNREMRAESLLGIMENPRLSLKQGAAVWRIPLAISEARRFSRASFSQRIPRRPNPLKPSEVRKAPNTLERQNV